MGWQALPSFTWGSLFVRLVQGAASWSVRRLSEGLNGTKWDEDLAEHAREFQRLTGMFQNLDVQRGVEDAYPE